MPAGSAVWTNIIQELEALNFTPKLWFGDPIHDDFAKKNYPDCEVFDFFFTHKIISLNCTDFDIDPEVLQSKSFFVLKDQVYKIMDRQDDLGVYNRLDREAFFYSIFCFFYSKIKHSQIELTVVAEGPHSPVSMIIYGICNFLNIPSYHLVQNSLAPLVHIAKDLYGTKLQNLKKLDNYNKKKLLQLVEDYIDSINNDIPTPLYMKVQNETNKIRLLYDFKKYIVAPVRRSFNYSNKQTKLTTDYSIYKAKFYKSNRPSIFHELQIAIKKAGLESQYNKVSKAPDIDKSYVFVPLHYEPERTSNPDGGHFYNVYDMLVSLRSFIPTDIKIILKEHPSQFTKTLHGHRGRSGLFYKSISTLPNVEFAAISTPSSILIKNSIFLATQTGTAALEAALLGKKSLIFGTPWFLDTPNLYIYNSISFDDLMNEKAHSKENVKKHILGYVTDYTLPACVNPSGFNYYSKKYPHDIDNLLNDKQFAKDFISIIVNDLQPN